MGFPFSYSSASSRHPLTCDKRSPSTRTRSSMVSRAPCREVVRSSTAGSMAGEGGMGMHHAAGPSGTCSFTRNCAVRV